MAPPMPNRIEITSCIRKEPPHPCDPKPPCDICDDSAKCTPPTLCTERLKNPMKAYETRCKTGEFINVQACKRKEPHHPCDPALPCKSGKPKKELCPEVALCRNRIKNPVSPVIRCLEDERNKYSPQDVCKNVDILKQPIKECPKERCPQQVQINPFDTDIEKKVEESSTARTFRPPHYSHKELCENLDLLKQNIKECFKPRPCNPPVQINPFEAEKERKRLQANVQDENPCAKMD